MNYPPLPDFSTYGDIWGAILDWEGSESGSDSALAAKNVDQILISELYAYVDADREHRKHTEAEVQELLAEASKYKIDLIDDTESAIRRILGVPAP